MLRGVLIQQVLEVGGAGAQDHLVGFGVLALEDLMKVSQVKHQGPWFKGFPKYVVFQSSKSNYLPRWQWSRHRSSFHPWDVWRRRPCWSGNRSSGDKTAVPQSSLGWCFKCSLTQTMWTWSSENLKFDNTMNLVRWEYIYVVYGNMKKPEFVTNCMDQVYAELKFVVINLIQILWL